ncbi:MAG: hypothetical protein O3A10_09980 [Chloroflexi bacterium]|nr:hypothetical protein [Chloroflexota bacterium]MDA1147537.1 hypothetical protein [Chloroflexota bacterium]
MSSARGDQFWFQLDSGRNAFLQRYVVLLAQGFTDPSFFDVLQVARETRRERVDVRLRVDVQMTLLHADQADWFWPEFLSATPRAELVPADFEGGEGTHFGQWQGGYWPVYRDQDVRIELTLPEGRRVEYTLFRPEAFLARAPEGWPSWPAWNAPPELLSVIDELVGPPRVNHRAAPEPDVLTIRISPLVRTESEPLPPQSTALASVEIARGAILTAILISTAVGLLVTRRRATR